MNVINYVGYPLDYAPGGHKDQIYNTINNLNKLGVKIEWLHNESQDLNAKYDIVHFWSYPNETTLKSIKSKLNSKIVWSTMLPTAGARSKVKMELLKTIVKIGRKFKHPKIQNIFPDYTNIDALIVLSELEKEHFSEIWGIPKGKIFVVPNGIDEEFFLNDIESIPFEGLLQIGAITQIKNSVEVAKAAKIAGIKVKFIGGFRLDDQNYRDEFIKEVDNQHVFWEGPIYDRKLLIKHMKGSKGIIQPSKWEAYPLVAAEAITLGKKVLLPNAKNLRCIYEDNAFYCSQPTSKKFIKELIDFTDIESIKNNFKAFHWKEIADKILSIYEDISEK